MTALADIRLSPIEVLSLMGFAQCVVILVYIIFRVRYWRPALVSIGYFFFLAVYFALHMALRLDVWIDGVRIGLWCARAMGPPLCFLLVLQVAKPGELPQARHMFVLLVVPVVFALAWLYAQVTGLCTGGAIPCGKFFDLLFWLGAMAGGVCLLMIWGTRNLVSGLLVEKSGRERYWLVLTFVVINIVDVGIFLLVSLGSVNPAVADFLQVILGLVFVYLVSTTLFRVYPQSLQLNTVSRTKLFGLSEGDLAAAEKVRDLIDLDKLYQQPGFSRADLARAAGVSESRVSRIVNEIFGQSFPQLLIERRVAEAKIMLQDPALPVNVVATEAGFNSIASFNRAFRDVTGDTPTGWREKNT